MDWQEFIHTDREILGGKPIIRGTRLSVEFILGRLADGWTEQEIFESYPSIKSVHLQAIHAYVLDVLSDVALFAAEQKAAA